MASSPHNPNDPFDISHGLRPEQGREETHSVSSNARRNTQTPPPKQVEVVNSPFVHGETKESKAYEEDFRLAQSVIQKEAWACRQFYDLYAPALLRRLHRLTGKEDDAEDGLQLIFLEAFRSLPKYRGEGPLGAWLNRIASHIAMSLLRKRHRWRYLLESVSSYKPPTVGEVPGIPEEAFLREETRKLVWETLQRLSPLKRMAVMMCDIEGRSLEEAGEELGLPHGTMISRLYQGRKELRRLMHHESIRRGLSLGDWIHG